ncbi:MAG: hypothetical protein KJ622_16760 [Alphaproteobacteria bacterium]|nr:hypothetical protein [Alphaproteobacteria bacterium]
MKPQHSRDRKAMSYLRGAMALIALTLPLLSLSGFGIWWLWQNGWLLVWSAVATSIAILIYAVEALLIWRTGPRQPASADATRGKVADSKGGRFKSQTAHAVPLREQQAIDAVEAIAADVDPAMLTSREAILQAGIDTVEAVARQMYPSEKEPLWKFTVPEALAVVEQVSRQVNKFVVENVPLGERVTVGQLLTLYRWRSLISTAERAYDLWRILRFANPVSAVAGEIREKVSGQFIEGMRTELMRRVARSYIREVGTAAIDLYSGRLRPEFAPTHNGDKAEAAVAQLAARPLNILVIGQQGVGRSDVIASLAMEMDAVVETEGSTSDGRTTLFKQNSGEFSALIVEPPALSGDVDVLKEILARARDCDIVLSVVSASRPDRAADSEALNAIRTEIAALTDRTAPPIAVALTDVDKLRPFKEWAPPYDLNASETQKAQSIREAVEAVAEDLDLETDAVIPVVAAPALTAYNIDALVAEIVEIIPEARRAQITRQLATGATSPVRWRQIWGQALNAGKVLARTAVRGGAKQQQ